MITIRQAVVVAVSVVASHFLCAGGGRPPLFPRSWGHVIVVTDVTAAGRAATSPTKDEPVYYLGRTLGCRLGSIAGDRMPDEKALSDFTARILAGQGYLGAQPGVHEPALLLVLQWGYLRPGDGDLLWFLGYDARRDIAAPDFPGRLGPEIWRQGFRSREIETILQSAKDDLYGVIVTAFEYESARTASPVVLWQTRMGFPANGKSMAEALPAMIQLAGPYMGRETSLPVLRGADDRYVGTVRYGELEVLEDGDGDSGSAEGLRPDK